MDTVKETWMIQAESTTIAGGKKAPYASQK